MNEADKEIIIKRYRARLKQFGIDIRTLASGKLERQKIRYKVLSEVGDLQNKSILDLGCGFGDFYQYLTERNIQVKYTGYDIVPDFIEIARKRFPEAIFEVKDIQVDTCSKKFDYIVSSQVFNNKLHYADNMIVIKDILARCYKLCAEGVAIDLLSSYVDFKEPHLYYYNPEDIFKYCKKLTKRVTLRHDYPLFEFTIYMYRDFHGWRK